MNTERVKICGLEHEQWMMLFSDFSSWFLAIQNILTVRHLLRFWNIHHLSCLTLTMVATESAGEMAGKKQRNILQQTSTRSVTGQTHRRPGCCSQGGLWDSVPGPLSISWEWGADGTPCPPVDPLEEVGTDVPPLVSSGGGGDWCAPLGPL